MVLHAITEYRVQEFAGRLIERLCVGTQSPSETVLAALNGSTLSV